MHIKNKKIFQFFFVCFSSCGFACEYPKPNEIAFVREAATVQKRPARKIRHSLNAHRCSIDAQDELGTTALMDACAQGNLVKARALGLLGANPKLADQKGRTALHFAYRNPFAFPAFAQLLVFFKADPNAQDCNGQTVLMRACARKDLHSAKRLLDLKANPNLVDRRKRSALSFAFSGIDHRRFREAHFQLIELLLNRNAVVQNPDPRIAVDAQDSQGNTFLKRACAAGKISRARSLLAAKANPNILNHKNNSALHCSLIHKDDKGRPLVKLLLQHNASADCAQFERQPATMCVDMQSPKSFRLILNAGADFRKPQKGCIYNLKIPLQDGWEQRTMANPTLCQIISYENGINDRLLFFTILSDHAQNCRMQMGKALAPVLIGPLRKIVYQYLGYLAVNFTNPDGLNMRQLLCDYSISKYANDAKKRRQLQKLVGFKSRGNPRDTAGAGEEKER